MKKPLIIFDVNESLVDLETLSPIFERNFGARHAMRLWYVASQLGAKPSELLLVACHTWGIIGAVAAGWLLGIGPQPHFFGKNLGDIAAQLIERYGSLA